MTPHNRESPKRLRVGAVSFFNTLPLTYGLESDPGVELVTAVPSRLAGLLERGAVDVALVPAIDWARNAARWRIVSDACIACDGATLTVRVFSRLDPSDVTTLHVDGDSHSSAALASVIWQERFGRELSLRPINARGAMPEELADCQAVLLIGDKVIRPPVGLDVFSTQVDLGATWKSLTGLPFVFAVWAAGEGCDAKRAAAKLSAARDAGVARAEQIAVERGPAMGWPVELARRYFTEYLGFTLSERHRHGMRRFIELARRYGLLDPLQEPALA